MLSPLPDKSKAIGWVQTDRRAHEDWARLCVQHPKAGALLHLLAAQVGEHNAVVVSHRVLAKLMGVKSLTTVKTALSVLAAGRWIEIRQIGDTGSVNAYVLNSHIAWSGPRDGLRYALFSATVIVSNAEQPDAAMLDNQEPLRPLPRIASDERQLPSGDGEPPPSQPFLDGLEPDLPALSDVSRF